jgi:UDP-N-acetylglucosamine transferase subunit ALG13
MSTFVSLGNGTQNFGRLLTKLDEIYSKLPQPVIVQHGNSSFARSDAHTFAFVDENEFQTILQSCNIFISHGGGGSVFAALRFGIKPIVVPRLSSFNEIVDDHQVDFTRELAKKGLVYPVYDISDLQAAVELAVKQPRLEQLAYTDNSKAKQIIADAVESFAPNNGTVLLVTPSGGHLSEIRALSNCYANKPHYYVINVPIIETSDMQGRTQVITLSQRDWKFLVNLKEAFSIIRRERPKVILTTGGGFSVAFALVGKLFGVPTVYVETVAKVVVPTATGKIMYWLVDRFFYQWPYLESYFPRAEYVGLIL